MQVLVNGINNLKILLSFMSMYYLELEVEKHSFKEAGKSKNEPSNLPKILM